MGWRLRAFLTQCSRSQHRLLCRRSQRPGRAIGKTRQGELLRGCGRGGSWAELSVEASPGSFVLWERWAPGMRGPRCLAAAVSGSSAADLWLEAPGMAAGSLPLPACSGVWGWESTASSEASGSLKTRSVDEVQRKSMGQLGVLDAR